MGTAHGGGGFSSALGTEQFDIYSFTRVLSRGSAVVTDEVDVSRGAGCLNGSCPCCLYIFLRSVLRGGRQENRR